MTISEAKVFKYPWYWCYRHLLHIFFVGIFSVLITCLPLDVISQEPYVWLKLWAGLTGCVIWNFLWNLRIAKRIEIIGNQVTLNFNILRSYTFTLGQVTIERESKPTKVKNVYGSEELKFIDGKRVAHVPLKMNDRDEFLKLVNNYIKTNSVRLDENKIRP